MRGEATKHCKLPWAAETVGNSPSKLLRLYKHFASIHLRVSLNNLCRKISSRCLEILCSLKCRVRLNAWGLFPVALPMNGSFKGQKLSQGPPPGVWDPAGAQSTLTEPPWGLQTLLAAPAFQEGASISICITVGGYLPGPGNAYPSHPPPHSPLCNTTSASPPWQSLSVIYRPARLCKEMLLWKHLRLPFVYLITQHTACLSPVYLLIKEKLFSFATLRWKTDRQKDRQTEKKASSYIDFPS